VDEEFKDIDGFAGYRVNRDGEVQSCWKRSGLRDRMTSDWLPLRPIRRKHGHLSVNLHRGGTKTPKYIHHLVLETFVGPRPPGLICCHWDGDPANNRVENLRWDTHRANCNDMLRHGTRRRGETGTKARLREGDVLEIRKLGSEGADPHDLSVRYEVGVANIQAILKGRTWRHLL
jgi:hypothetical protein